MNPKSRRAKLYTPLILTALLATLGVAVSAEKTDETQAAVVRLLVPPGEELSGKVELEVLAIDPEIRDLLFTVDGEEAARSSHLPWNVKVKLANPPREQTLEAALEVYRHSPRFIRREARGPARKASRLLGEIRAAA